MNATLHNRLIQQSVQSMNESSSSKLKSKYESSSQKIKLLYEEFESLKRNMAATPAKAKNPNSNLPFDRVSCESAQLRTRHWLPKSHPLEQRPATLNHSRRSSGDLNGLKANLEKSVNTCSEEMSSHIHNAVKRLHEKLTMIENIVHKVQRIRLDVGRARKAKQAVRAMTLSHKKEIEQLTMAHKSQIQVLMQENKKTQASEAKAKKQIEFKLSSAQRQLNTAQQQILAQDQHITQLQSQIVNSGGRLSPPEQMHSKDLCDGAERGNNEREAVEVQELSHKVSELTAKKASLESEVSKLQLRKAESSKHIEQQLGDSLRVTNKAIGQKSNTLTFSQQINGEDILTDSENEEREGFPENLGFSSVNNFEPLRHSHVIHDPKVKKCRMLEREVKQLQSELQLVTEENRVLKGKKDKFEEQVKQNEEDEQKFQIQGQILRDELRRVNTSLKALDECAVQAIASNSKIQYKKIEILDESLAFRTAYISKHYPNLKNRSPAKSKKK